MSSFLRRLGGAALAAVGALCLAAPAPAQDARLGALPLSDDPAGVHVVTLAPDGAVVCAHPEHADAPAARQARTAQKVRLTEVTSTNPAGSTAFRIVLRATDQLLDRPEALLAFRRSAAVWERIIQTPITAVIDVDYGPTRFGTPYPSADILGSTNSALRTTSLTPADVVTRLKAATSDPALTALYDAIPVPTPSTARNGDQSGAPLGTALVGTIPLQAYGDLPAVFPAGATSGVPSIGFNSAFAFDLDPSNGVAAGEIDFEGVAVHEIGHALGFVSAIGNGGPPENLFTPWDLFRVRPDAVTPGESYTDGAGWETAERVVTPGPVETDVIATEGGRQYFAAVQTTFFGDAEIETSTATGAGEGGDGQQASHWRDDARRRPSLGSARKIGIMDPNLAFGVRDEVTEADIRLLELIGYRVDYDPVFAEARFTLNGERLDTETSVGGPVVLDEVALGDAPAGGTASATLRIENRDPQDALSYEVSFEAASVLPAGAAPSVPTVSGTVAAGAAEDVEVVFGGPEAAFVLGHLIVRTNDRSQLVVDVPVTFSVGGAREARLGVETSAEGGVLGDIPAEGQTTYTVTLRNEGSFPLTYALEAVLTRDDAAFTTDPGARRAGDAPLVLFDADFDDAARIGSFLAAGPNAADWRETRVGPAGDPGHSAPTAAHFGVEIEDEVDGLYLDYRNNASGTLYTPSFSLAPYGLQDAVTVSFAYYLDAQPGDVVEVVTSTDDGATATVLTSSDGGLLLADGTWRTLTLPVSGLAGQPARVRFGWRFTSDGAATGTGFLLDDVRVEVTEGAGFFASGLDGTLAGGASETVTLTIDGGNLGPGFYLARVRAQTNERLRPVRPIDVRFTVGGGTYPSLVATGARGLNVEAESVTPFTLATRNPSNAVPLTYLRVLEPALSRLDPADLAARTPAPRAEAPATLSAPEAVEAKAGAAQARLGARAEVVLPGAQFPIGLGALPDGRLLVSDGEQRDVVYVVGAGLSGASTVAAPAADQQITGFAYDEASGSIWLAEFQNRALKEVRLEAGGLAYTGASVPLGFPPINLSYSAELDAFFVMPYESTEVYAVSREGDVLPGYPVALDLTLRTTIPALSFREGVLEVSEFVNSVVQTDQFGRPFDEAQETVIESEGATLGGARGFYAYERSRTDPDGLAYVVTTEGSDGAFRVVSLDPVDLPASVFTRIDAAEPLGADQAVAPGAAFGLDLRLDARGLEDDATYVEDLAFLVNDPSAPVVRIPVAITRYSVAGEGGPEADAFSVTGAVPNPLRAGGEVRFTLAEAAETTVTVYNVLGQRVAVLAERAPLGAGAHALPIEAGALAAGTYVVRVEAGAEAGTRTLTVVR